MINSTSELLKCPCCGERTLSEYGSYEICKICLWEDDLFQSRNPDYAGGINSCSLNEARKKWEMKNQSEY